MVKKLDRYYVLYRHYLISTLLLSVLKKNKKNMEDTNVESKKIIYAISNIIQYSTSKKILNAIA